MEHIKSSENFNKKSWRLRKSQDKNDPHVPTNLLKHVLRKQILDSLEDRFRYINTLLLIFTSAL